MAFTLTLLGTDTDYTPKADSPGYPKGETLSFVSTIIEGAQAEDQNVNEIQQLNNNAVALIKGPETRGRNVGDRIARAVLSILEAIARGEKKITITAHSRGAVEAILVAHEIERIQKLLADKNFNNLEEIRNSICPLTKAAMNSDIDSMDKIAANDARLGDLKGRFEALDFRTIAHHIGPTKLAIFNIDPVPGGAFFLAQGVRWFDTRFYQIPAIVEEYEQYVYENERTRCFKAIIPAPLEPTTKFKLYGMPGHHGTGSGNFNDQQQVAVPADKGKTKHVQQLMLLKAVDFLQRNGVTFTQALDRIEGLNPKLRDLVKDCYSSPSAIKREYIRLYGEIVKNRAAYEHFNGTSYGWLLQEQGILKLTGLKTDQRIVHHQSHVDTFLPTILPALPSGNFLNTEHARLVLEERMRINEDRPLSEMVEQAFNLIRSCCEKYDGWSLIPEHDQYDPSQSTEITPMLKSKEGFNLFLEGIDLVIDQVSQSYLQDKWVNTDERARLYNVLASNFSRLQDLPDNDIAAKVIAHLNDKLNTTLQTKYNNLVKAYNSITETLTADKFYYFEQLLDQINHILPAQTIPNSDSQIMIELRDFYVRRQADLRTLKEQDASPEEIQNTFRSMRETIDHQLQVYINEEDGPYVVAIGDAISEIVSISQTSPSFPADVIQTYRGLDEHINSLDDFKPFNPNVDLKARKIELRLKRSDLLINAVNYVRAKNLNLENDVRPLFGEDENSLELYNQIAVLVLGKETFDALEVERNELNQQKGALEGTLEEKKQALVAKDSQLAGMQSQLESLTAAQHDTQLQLEALTKANESLQHQVSTQQQEMQGLGTQIDSLKKQNALYQKENESQKRRIELNTEITAFPTASEVAQAKELELKQIEILDLEEQLAAQAAALATKEEAIAALTRQLAQQTAQSNDGARKIAELEERVTSQQQTISQLSESNTNKEQEFQALSTNHTSLLEGMEGNQRALGQRNEALLRDWQQLNEQNAQLQRQHATVTEQNAGFQTANQTLRGQKAQLEADKQAGQEQITRLEAEKQTLEEQKTGLAAENKTLQEQNTGLEAENKTLQEQNSGLEAENKTLREQNTELTRNAALQQANYDRLGAEFEKFKKVYEPSATELINKKLVPLTEAYLTHLLEEARAEDPALSNTSKTYSEAVAAVATSNIPKLLKDKITTVNNLKENLDNNDLTATKRVVDFYSTLDANNSDIKTHRDARWKRWVANTVKAAGIILTGVLPGLAVLGIFSAVTGKSPLYWRSHGNTFFKNVKDVEPEELKTPKNTPKENPPQR